MYLFLYVRIDAAIYQRVFGKISTFTMCIDSIHTTQPATCHTQPYAEYSWVLGSWTCASVCVRMCVRCSYVCACYTLK